MKFRAGEHDHSYHIVHIAEAKGSADDEFDLVVSRLGASIRQLEPCGGNDICDTCSALGKQMAIRPFVHVVCRKGFFK